MMGNSKPRLRRTGTVGDITELPTGWILSGFDNMTFVYIDRGVSNGKWYWEVTQGAYVLLGVTDDPMAVVNYGGYPSTNAGVYLIGDGTGGEGWVDGGWAGGNKTGLTGPVPIGGTIGLALDMGGKSLKFYVNNSLYGEINWSSGPARLYPLFAFQVVGASDTIEIRSLRQAFQYPPPAGYNAL